MRRRLIQIAIALFTVGVLAQFIRPGRANPPTDPNATIQAQAGMNGVGAVLTRSCGDCHSNTTAWSSWYTQVAPLSWLMAHEVAAGRQAVNFSEWSAYTPDQQRTLLSVSCDDAKSGKMPGPYPFFKPETQLSVQDIQTICTAARQTEAKPSGAFQ
jgi:Haem-binding domain